MLSMAVKKVVFGATFEEAEGSGYWLNLYRIYPTGRKTLLTRRRFKTKAAAKGFWTRMGKTGKRGK